MIEYILYYHFLKENKQMKIFSEYPVYSEAQMVQKKEHSVRANMVGAPLFQMVTSMSILIMIIMFQSPHHPEMKPSCRQVSLSQFRQLLPPM
jgi:hypothetical protein